MAKYLKVPKFLIVIAGMKFKKQKKKKKKKRKKVGVVSQYGLAIYILKSMLRQKEE
jgi:hypothetical protein